MEFMARWPLVTRTRFNILAVKYNQLELQESVSRAAIEIEQDRRDRMLEDLIDCRKALEQDAPPERMAQEKP